jgi:hypothetical protein
MYLHELIETKTFAKRRFKQTIDLFGPVFADQRQDVAVDDLLEKGLVRFGRMRLGSGCRRIAPMRFSSSSYSSPNCRARSSRNFG